MGAQEVGVKGKLEQLFRKLKQQEAALKDDRKRFADQETKRRQDLADEFQNTISNVKKTMDQHAQERTRLLKEHEELLQRRNQIAQDHSMQETLQKDQKATQSEE